MSRHGSVENAISEASSVDWQVEYGQWQTTLIRLVAGSGLAAKMPERPLTIATYAAGASLAAITLVYVFGPTFFLDDEAANSSKSSRKKGVVGLKNPANDCFINSVLQALAGLPELRVYLIRETHRRKLDGQGMYNDLTAALEEQERKQNSKQMPEWKLLGLQQGLVTAGLKDVLDALNERPIYKKTISAQAFIRVVEQSFRTRISRSQQDAQEFLQIVAERLAEEHAAGRRVRRRGRRKGELDEPTEAGAEASNTFEDASNLKQSVLQVDATSTAGPRDSKTFLGDDKANRDSPDVEVTPPRESEEDGEEEEPFTFPLEGRIESQVECSHCHFKPRPHKSSFVTLTLNVPYNSGASTLNACFDGMFKQEQIDDFTCDRCRLEHALSVNARQLSKAGLYQRERTALEADKDRLETALREDPENPPKDVKLPNLSTAPKRRISRHMRISKFPRVLAIHLSRSVWAENSSSSKNTAKVSFPESLPLGGLLDRKMYRLLGAVTHKGGHNSGHYESFRRQVLSPPYSTKASMGTEGIYSMRSTPAPSPRVSAAPSPRLSGRSAKDQATESARASPSPQLTSTPSLESPSTSSLSSRSIQSPLSDRQKQLPPTSVPLEAIPTPGLPTPPPEKQSEPAATKRGSSLSVAVNRAKGKKGPDRWWRISDEKIKECKTNDVLGMQREVYLLFYELVDESHA